MNTSNILNFAEKYNWWTPDKSKLSLESKIEYVLQYGNLDELREAVISLGGTAKIRSVWQAKQPKVRWKKCFDYYLKTHES